MMAIERMPLVARVPGVRAVETEVLRVPTEADAALIADFDAVVFDRGLLAADLVLLRREKHELAGEARELARRNAALEVALWRAGRREPSVLRLGAGLALLALLVLCERLGLLARWVWGCVRLGAVLLVWRGVLRWDRLDRGNVSPLTRMLCCAALFLGCVLAFGR